MCVDAFFLFFFFSSRRRHTRFSRDWSSDVCSSDLSTFHAQGLPALRAMQFASRADEKWIAQLDKGGRGFTESNGAGSRRSEERRVGKECRSRGAAYH